MKEIKGKVKRAVQILWENKYRMTYYMLIFVHFCLDAFIMWKAAFGPARIFHLIIQRHPWLKPE